MIKSKDRICYMFYMLSPHHAWKEINGIDFVLTKTAIRQFVFHNATYDP